MNNKLSPLIAWLAVLIAAALCLGVAIVVTLRIEDRTLKAVILAMREEGLDWVDVRVDGLRVLLSGTAPDEAARFRALVRTGAVVDANRVIDGLGVAAPAAITPPRFVLNMWRDDDDISLTGLIPEAVGKAAVVDRVAGSHEGITVADMLGHSQLSGTGRLGRRHDVWSAGPEHAAARPYPGL